MKNIKRIGMIFLLVLLAATMLLTSCDEAIVPGVDDITTIETTTVDTTTVADTTTAATTTTEDITQSETVAPNDSTEVTPSDGTTTAAPNDTTVEVTPSTTTTVAPTEDTTTVVTPSNDTTTYVPNDTTTAAPSDDTTTVPDTTTERPATTTAATTTQKPVTTTTPPASDLEPTNLGVKIITWNICGYNGEVQRYGRVDKVTTVIKAHPADVYCLQEVGIEWDPNTVKTKVMAGYTLVEKSAEFPIGATETDLSDYLSNHIYYNSNTLTLIDSDSKILVKENTKLWSDEAGKTVKSTRDRLVTWAVFEHKATGKQFMVFNAHLDAQYEVFRMKGVETLYD